MCVCIYVHICMCVYMYLCMHVCVCVYVCMYVCLCVCVCMYVCMFCSILDIHSVCSTWLERKTFMSEASSPLHSVIQD